MGVFNTSYRVSQYTHDNVVKFILELDIIDEWCLNASVEKLNERMESEENISDIVETTGYTVADIGAVSPEELAENEKFIPGIDQYSEYPGISHYSGKYNGFGLYTSLNLQQERRSITSFAKEIAKSNPKTILEIGSAEGGSFYLWNRYIDTVDKAISLDISYPGKKKRFFTNFSESEIHCVEGDSNQKRTIKKVREILKEDKIDFLYIDGDHSYNGVKKDFEKYSQLVSENGLIGLHDISHPGTGVPDYWSELKEKYSTAEFGSSVFKNGLVRY